MTNLAHQNYRGWSITTVHPQKPPQSQQESVLQIGSRLDPFSEETGIDKTVEIESGGRSIVLDMRSWEVFFLRDQCYSHSPSIFKIRCHGDIFFSVFSPVLGTEFPLYINDYHYMLALREHTVHISDCKLTLCCDCCLFPFPSFV